MKTEHKPKVLIIAPLPPPITGNSIAVQMLMESEEIKTQFSFSTINLSNGEVSGKFSLNKFYAGFRYVGHIRRCIKNEKIENFYITIAQSFLGNIRDLFMYWAIYRYSKNAKVVLHLHGGYFRKYLDGQNFIMQYWNQKYLAKAKKIIVLGETLRPIFLGICDHSKIEIVENCVDKSFLIDETKYEKKMKGMQGENKPFHVLYLSLMYRSKGWFDVLKAAALLKENKRIQFHFAGNFIQGTEKELFDNFIKENQLEETVHYHGVVVGKEKLDLLENSHLFVLPTYYQEEGQPISIIEAMSAGMPVITTRHGGIPDLIEDGENGFFVLPERPDQIKDKIVALHENKMLFEKISKGNYQKVKEKFTLKEYTSKMLKVFQQGYK